MPDRLPYISISMIIGVQRERAERALASVLTQDALDHAEVLLFDTAHGQFPPLAGSRHPAVKVIPMDASLPFSRMLVIGIERSRGEIVAFTEDHVIRPSGWLRTLVSEFHEPYAAVGGEPFNLNPGSGLSDITDLVNYRDFHDLLSPHLTTLMPGHNSAYRREILLSFGSQLPMLIGCEPLLSQAMSQRGCKMLLHPGASYHHENIEYVSMIFDCTYHWNRCFGAWRAEMEHWGLRLRLLQLLKTPLIPIVRYVQLFHYLVQYERSRLRLFVLQSTPILLIHTAAALGIAAGCLAGVGNSDRMFGSLELNHSRIRAHRDPEWDKDRPL